VIHAANYSVHRQSLLKYVHLGIHYGPVSWVSAIGTKRRALKLNKTWSSRDIYAVPGFLNPRQMPSRLLSSSKLGSVRYGLAAMLRRLQAQYEAKLSAFVAPICSFQVSCRFHDVQGITPVLPDSQRILLHEQEILPGHRFHVLIDVGGFDDAHQNGMLSSESCQQTICIPDHCDLVSGRCVWVSTILTGYGHLILVSIGCSARLCPSQGS